MKEDTQMIQCPFYKGREGGKSLVCEGFGDAKSLAQVYPSRGKLRKQMEVFCCHRYRNCEVYRLLMHTKYEEDD